jgi:hypothetical protein
VLNTTFKNISFTTFVAEIGVPREIHTRKKIYNQSLGAYEKKTILDEVVFILFLSYICI